VSGGAPTPGPGATVAVVVPAYNAARQIEQTLRSVLAQTRPAEEVIVVDDGSTDDTAAVVGRYAGEVRCIRQANAGVSAARNRGIEEAGTSHVAFLDSDDLFAPDKLERQLGELGGGAVAVSTGAVQVDERLRPLAVRRPRFPPDLLVQLFVDGNIVGSPSSVMASRSVLRSLGGFDERLSFAADWDLWIRLCRAGRFGCVADPLIAYRLHGSSMSADPDLVESDSMAMLKRALADPECPRAVRAQSGRIRSRQYGVAAGCHLQGGNRPAAVRCLLRGAAASPATAGRMLGRAARSRLTRSRDPVGSGRLGSTAYVTVAPADATDAGIEWLDSFAIEPRRA